MTKFQVGDRVTLTGAAVQYRFDRGGDLFTSVSAGHVTRGAQGVVVSPADAEGDVEVRFDNDALSRCAPELLTAPVMVDAEVAARVSAAKLDELADHAAYVVWGALHGRSACQEMSLPEIKAFLLERLAK